MPNIDLALVICDQETDSDNIIESAVTCGLNSICCSNLEEALRIAASGIQNDFLQRSFE